MCWQHHLFFPVLLDKMKCFVHVLTNLISANILIKFVKFQSQFLYWPVDKLLQYTAHTSALEK